MFLPQFPWQRFQGFYFNLHIVAKSTGPVCRTLDPKWLKGLILDLNFCMDSSRSTTTSLHQQDLLASVNSKYAYLHVPIFLVHRSFLCFAVAPLHFQFVALFLLSLICTLGVHKDTDPNISPTALLRHLHCEIPRWPPVEETEGALPDLIFVCTF